VAAVMFLIGIFKAGDKTIPKLISIRDYNEAVDKLNSLLNDKKLVDYYLPEEKPLLAKQLGLR
jgi:hypothetical protein